MTRVSFHPSARVEVRRARQWYAEQNPEAARRFMTELARAVRVIREAPLRWPLIDAVRRRFVLVDFPYNVVYRPIVAQDLIRILAIAHQHRRPGYWSRR